MRTIKTNSAEFKAKLHPYILDCISSEDVVLTTDKEKLQYLIDTFYNEYCHAYNLKYYGSYQLVFENWLRGLPSAFTIDYENYRIIELAKEWGSLAIDANDKQEDKVLNSWWAVIYMGVSALCRKYDIDFIRPVK